jgi:adenylate kinase
LPVECGKCGGPLVQRADDTDAVVRERLSVYRRDTKPLVEYYHRRPTFCSIDGAQTPDQVTADIASAVEGAAARGGARVVGGRVL